MHNPNCIINSGIGSSNVNTIVSFSLRLSAIELQWARAWHVLSYKHLNAWKSSRSLSWFFVQREQTLLLGKQHEKPKSLLLCSGLLVNNGKTFNYYCEIFKQKKTIKNTICHDRRGKKMLQQWFLKNNIFLIRFLLF